MNSDEHFFRVGSVAAVGRILADKILRQLSHGPVLWLLSGGSAVDVAVACANHLGDKDLSKLTISLVDERYGPAGHADSNWQQLLNGGLRAPGARLRPYLSEKSFDETLEELDHFFKSAFETHSFKIALLGMGSDGHTAGILPGSPATTSGDVLVGYRAESYQRLTLSFKGIQKLDEAVLYAVGESKSARLDILAEQNIEPARQPAQIIKTLASWSVYNDRIGEAI